MTHSLGTTADMQEIPRPTSATGLQWALLLLVTVGVLIAFIDRSSIAAAVADKGFVGDFGLSNVDRGWVNAAFFWSYGVVQVIMGSIIDRYGVKWPYLICFFLWCAATIITGFITGFAALIVMRLIVGGAESVTIPASYRWIRNNFQENQAGTAVGIFTCGNKIGSAVGVPIGAWLIVHYDWRMMFFVTGAIGIVWLIPWLLLVPSDLPASRQQDEAARRKASSVTYGDILSSPVIWGALIINFAYGYLTFFCATWMPSYLVEQRGLSLEQSGFFTFLSFAGVAAVAVLAGWASDKIIDRGADPVLVRKSFIVAGFIGGCTVLLGAKAQSTGVALFWNVASLSLLGLATANIQTLCRLTLIPKQAVGRVTGVQQVATSLAGGTVASLSGWLLHISGSYDLPMYIIFVVLIIGAAATVILLQPKWSPKVVEQPAEAEASVA
jgi:sugar phosphate permease